MSMRDGGSASAMGNGGRGVLWNEILVRLGSWAYLVQLCQSVTGWWGERKTGKGSGSLKGCLAV